MISGPKYFDFICSTCYIFTWDESSKIQIWSHIL